MAGPNSGLPFVQWNGLRRHEGFPEAEHFLGALNQCGPDALGIGPSFGGTRKRNADGTPSPGAQHAGVITLGGKGVWPKVRGGSGTQNPKTLARTSSNG